MIYGPPTLPDYKRTPLYARRVAATTVRVRAGENLSFDEMCHAMAIPHREGLTQVGRAYRRHLAGRVIVPENAGMMQ